MIFLDDEWILSLDWPIEDKSKRFRLLGLIENVFLQEPFHDSEDNHTGLETRRLSVPKFTKRVANISIHTRCRKLHRLQRKGVR